MYPDTLEKLMIFAADHAPYLIATADEAGQPHIAAAGKLSAKATDLVEITDWFCVTTVNNLYANPRISLVIWDRTRDFGYQLLGQNEKIEDIAMMDGYSPELEAAPSVPQVERGLIVRITGILDFSLRRQSDREQQNI